MVPAQFTGDKSNAIHSIAKSSAADAKRTYEQAKERLLQVNEWKHICGPHSADFQLTDKHGMPLDGKANTGNYIRVNLPGPGTKVGNGYDWVMIEEIDVKNSPSGNSNYISMRVRPVANPFGNEDETAHFYEAVATSSFIVERIGLRISAGVYGRNEVPNMKVSSPLDKVRNFGIFLSTVFGFQKPQWKSLAEALLK
jgi:hypothetical protein